ncbi:MAG: flavodoxin [Angelakisella sp.]|nr:flavodoxin [Angelakisella sp.]
MKQIFITTIAAVLLFALSACGVPQSSSQSPADTEEGTGNVTESPSAVEPSTPESSSLPEEAAPESNAAPVEDAGASEEETQGNKTLVAVFSLAGEQYGVGVIEKGNTAIIADMIVEVTGADLFSIEAVTPYPETYDGLLEISQQENQSDTRPAISGTVEDMEQYDRVFIGYPIWWGDMPAIVKGFLESYDFTGKTVIPFCTHGGSGLANTESAIAGLTGAEMRKGLAVSGATAQNDRDAARTAVTDWLEEVGVLG